MPRRLFGRESALADLSNLLDDSRLITLFGTPGCGKTRLAIELEARLGGRYAGLPLVRLAPVGHSRLVASAVARALGVADQPDRTVEEAIVETIATQELLLVLDNCEHVVDGVAALVSRVLGRCPSLRVLATSRNALGLRGEHVWQVPPPGPFRATTDTPSRHDLSSSSR